MVRPNRLPAAAVPETEIRTRGEAAMIARCRCMAVAFAVGLTGTLAGCAGSPAVDEDPRVQSTRGNRWVELLLFPINLVPRQRVGLPAGAAYSSSRARISNGNAMKRVP